MSIMIHQPSMKQDQKVSLNLGRYLSFITKIPLFPAVSMDTVGGHVKPNNYLMIFVHSLTGAKGGSVVFDP